MAQKKKPSGSKSKTTKRKTNAKTKPRGKATRGGTSKRTSSRRKSTPRKTSRSKKPRQIRLEMTQKMLIVGIGIVFLTAILVLSLLSPNQGQLTSGLSRLLMQLFGWGGVIVPLITGGIGLYLVLWGMDQSPKLPAYRVTGLALLFISFEALASFALVMMDNGLFDFWAVAEAGKGGGYLGGSLDYVLTESVGNWGAVFTLLLAATVGAILVSGVTREDIGYFLKYGLRKPKTDADVPANGRTTPTRHPSVEELLQPPLPLDEPDTAAKPPPKPKTEPKRKGRGRKKEKPAAEPAPTVPTPVFLGGKSSKAGNWKLPVMADMLELGTDNDPSGALIREQVEIIEHTLESFGAPATVIEINQGPTITQFGVEPSFLEMRSGKRTKVKVSKIAGLADDLALALHARSIRIQAPVPGKGYVGIEVPNPGKALVSLRDVMETKQFQKIKSLLRIGLGQDVGGQPITADLAGMPHLLIAGATGSGKSVMVNSLIACLLLQNTPDQLKLVMVDPKRVELTGYNGIPHLAAPVVVEMDRVIGVLQWAMQEMDSRYKMFADAGARNISDFNKKARRNKSLEPLPYIVIIIDELADLMMLAPEETERGVTRLAQLARATGIHMVIATQRPSVDVVTGLIKANFPARIAFAVASGTDSRVILDTTGAERLLGQGDMLYQSPDAAAPVRSQGCFVSDGELHKIIEYWRSARRFNLIPAEESIIPKAEIKPPTTEGPAQPVAAPVVNIAPSPAPAEQEAPTVEVTAVSPPPRPKPKPPAKKSTKKKEPPKQQPLWEALQEMEQAPPQYEDELMPEAIALVRQLNKASTSLLQRRFRIGYTRAARMIDAMEEMGIIGPPTGTSKAREVYPAPEETAENPPEEETEE